MYVISKKMPQQKIPLGFNIIASTGALNIAAMMFKSIAPISDQIVVVLDEKAPLALWELARLFTRDLYFGPWENFAVQRNRALEHTWTDYVAWIDLDEWYRPDVASRIHNLMTRPEGKAYYIWQASATNQGAMMYVPQVRLFPRREGVFWEIPIHEQILLSLDRVGVQTELTDLRVEHAGYVDTKEVMEKHKRNIALLRRRVREAPEDLFSQENYRQALKIDRAIQRYERVS